MFICELVSSYYFFCFFCLFPIFLLFFFLHRFVWFIFFLLVCPFYVLFEITHQRAESLNAPKYRQIVVCSYFYTAGINLDKILVNIYIYACVCLYIHIYIYVCAYLSLFLLLALPLSLSLSHSLSLYIYVYKYIKSVYNKICVVRQESFIKACLIK